MVEERTRIVAGCMTGTSLDGLDVALVRIIGSGLEMKAELLGHHALAMPDRLRSMLLAMASGEPAEPVEFMRAARALGRFHVEALEQLLAGGLAPPIDPGQLDFVTAHGQTIWHAPGDAPRYDAASGPKSWQLFDPWPIVHKLKVPVCYDLRQADLIAGGEGAPLTPIADWVMYRDASLDRYIVNLGGIANYTASGPDRYVDCLAADDLVGCNLILDSLVQHYWPGHQYDEGGMFAAKGMVVDDIDGLRQAVVQPKGEAKKRWMDGAAGATLGREDYSPEWIQDLLATHCNMMRGEDVLASVVDSIAWVIAALVDDYHRDQIVLAGGGCRNESLVASITAKANQFGTNTILSDDLGIPCEAREAMGFAVLGALSQDGVPISLPQVTGATDPGVAGVWAYP